MLTRTLLIAIALLVAAGIWRVARWYLRPFLLLPDDLVLERAASGIRVFLDVGNAGAGRAKECRAVLVRCERQEAVGWQRVEPSRAESRSDTDAGDPKPAGTGIPPDGTVRIELYRVLPDEPGMYRLEIAVINGEEKRSSYVIDMEAALAGVSA